MFSISLAKYLKDIHFSTRNQQLYMMEVPQILNFKIILVGHQGVGKSSLIARYIKGQFLDNYNVTVGVQYSTKVVNPQPGRQARLQIWDTAGQQLFRPLVKSFYKGICAAFLVFSLDSKETFTGLKSWADQIRQSSHQEVVIFVIAAKADIQEKRQVSAQEASELLKAVGGAFFIETSAKTGMNVDNLFKKCADILTKKYDGNSAFRLLVNPNDYEEGQKRYRSSSFALKLSNYQDLAQKNKKKSCCQ